MQVCKSSEQSRGCFDFICRKFSVLRMEKLKEGIFDLLQIRELMKDLHFQNSINTAEADAQSTFSLVERNFLEL